MKDAARLAVADESAGARGRPGPERITREQDRRISDVVAREQRLKEFNDRKEIDSDPVHRPHTGHKASLFKIPVFKHIQRIFSLTNRHPTGLVDQEILILIE